ncbi:MAG: UvrD-helicase domain-containing protein, partial [Nostocaceae cyanobacterium]|nr:UvrD-helicase domain-containing protein [Nostocaceae cyanobacterium]
YSSDVEQHFLELAQTFHQAYLDRLKATGEEDFDGLLQQAVASVTLGETVFRRKSGTGDLKNLRYILIDEYQDFSKLFNRLIEAIREQNPQAQFFCVGDDWQAINGFAGSDLLFYKDFSQFFQPSRKLTISTNYRSAISVVNLSNLLMQGLGTPARAYKTMPGVIDIVDLSAFEPTPKEIENHQGDRLTPAILRLVNKAIYDGKDVVMLSRKNSLPWHVNYGNRQITSRQGTLDNFLELVRSHLPEKHRENVSISTAHKYKGLEKKVVILLDAVPKCYPLLHSDMIFTQIFGDNIERIVDEERRLFYVALTRAVEHLFIITKANNLSPFLEYLQSKTTLCFLNWFDYLPLIGEIKHITVKIRNQIDRGSEGTFNIRTLLKAQGFVWNSQAKIWWRTYLAQNFSIETFFHSSEWCNCAHGIEIQFDDELETMIAMYRIDNGQPSCIINNLL